MNIYIFTPSQWKCDSHSHFISQKSAFQEIFGNFMDDWVWMAKPVWVGKIFAHYLGNGFSRNVDFRPYFSSALRGNGFVKIVALGGVALQQARRRCFFSEWKYSTKSQEKKMNDRGVIKVTLFTTYGARIFRGLHVWEEEVGLTKQHYWNLTIITVIFVSFRGIFDWSDWSEEKHWRERESRDLAQNSVL